MLLLEQPLGRETALIVLSRYAIVSTVQSLNTDLITFWTIESVVTSQLAVAYMGQYSVEIRCARSECHCNGSESGRTVAASHPACTIRIVHANERFSSARAMRSSAQPLPLRPVVPILSNRRSKAARVLHCALQFHLPGLTS